MIYKEYKGLNLPEIDKEVLTFWEKQSIFQKSINSRDENNPFIFFEGPPSANGLPGIHHVQGRTIKIYSVDIKKRFKAIE